VSELRHREIACNGISLHVAAQGSGPPVVFCHGWPELWYSWRYQLPAVAHAGFLAIAPDQRGFGRSGAPPEIADYAMEHLCGDLVALLDALDLESAVFVGHDWGGIVVWSMALHFPQRVRAVAAVNTPFLPRATIPPDWIQPGSKWDYQIYFNQVGAPEAEFEADVERFFKLLFRTHRPEDGGDYTTTTVTARGGLLVGAPTDIPRSPMLREEELQYFVDEYRRTGFRGGLNWYRNSDANWRYGEAVADRSVTQPALMVTAGRDPVLTPDMTQGMERWVPNLTRAHIEACGHWTQQECPQQLNKILIDWLRSL